MSIRPDVSTEYSHSQILYTLVIPLLDDMSPGRGIYGEGAVRFPYATFDAEAVISFHVRF